GDGLGVQRRHRERRRGRSAEHARACGIVERRLLRVAPAVHGALPPHLSRHARGQGRQGCDPHCAGSRLRAQSGCDPLDHVEGLIGVTALATAIALGVTLFVATNLDDIFILLVFFADPRFRARNILVGTYLGLGALVLISAVAALIALVIPPFYVKL